MSRSAVFEASLAYFLQPIARPLADDAVTEIMVNGPDRIFIERHGKLEQLDARFEDEDALLSAIHNLTQYVGRDISAEQVGARLLELEGAPATLTSKRSNRRSPSSS